jgi:hypothetical protein
MNDPFRTFSAPFPHKATQSNDPAPIPHLFHYCFVFLCWWERCGKGAEWVIHLIAEKAWFILCLSTSGGGFFTGYSQFIYPRNNYFHPL